MIASCIMPTANRRAFIPGAVARFLAQDFEQAELIILDDGDDPVDDLVPHHPAIRYHRTPRHRSLGAKRNAAVEAACGDVILHWDDDDWYAPHRIRLQVEALVASDADVCGVDRALFIDPLAQAAWEYVYPPHAAPWVCGATLCYRRDFWRSNRFTDISIGEDTRFVAGVRRQRLHVLADNRFFVALIHPANSSPKKISDRRWRRIDFPAVRDLTGADWLAPTPIPRRDRPAIPPPAASPAPAAAIETQGPGLSVVIPFSGRIRLGVLAACVASLRQCPTVDQIVIAEMAAEPAALATARRWGADHVFIATAGPFDKSRAINVGSLFARREEILWLDGDITVEPDVMSRAQREFRACGVDFFFPYSRINYLDEVESGAVRAGLRHPSDCRITRFVPPLRGGVDGGMGLVRGDFLRRHGGMIEGFFGWGGEDNAWVHKAGVFGRIGVSARTDQIVWHLHHAYSPNTLPGRTNAFYPKNLERLREIRANRTPADFERAFPPADHAVPPWPASTKIAIVTVTGKPGRDLAHARIWAERLRRAFGGAVGSRTATVAGLAGTLRDIAADVLVVVADKGTARRVLEAVPPDRPVIVALAEMVTGTLPQEAKTWVVARDRAQIERCRERGLNVWHQPWEDVGETDHALPMIAQVLTHVLAAPGAPGSASAAAAAAGTEATVWT